MCIHTIQSSADFGDDAGNSMLVPDVQEQVCYNT